MESQLVKLVNLFHAYEQQHPGAAIEEFCRYFLGISRMEVEQTLPEVGLPKNVLLSITLGRLARFADMYTKKALDGLPVANTDDMVYLMILDARGTPKKSELIQHGLSEFSTGVEIIRRLQKAGLVEEFPDAEDRRSKRIQLTLRGRQVLAGIYPRMNVVADIVAGAIAEEEKDLLLQILGRLEKLHDEVYGKVKPYNLEETAEVFQKKAPPAGTGEAVFKTL